MTRLATIVLVCAALPAVAATRVPPKPPTVRKATVKKVVPMPTQGSGALALTTKAVSAPAPRIYTNYFFFAATAVDTNKIESEYSTEVGFSTTNRYSTSVTLAWEYPYTNWTGVTFNVYRGRSHTNYSDMFSAGTNHQLAVPLYGPFYTNCVTTVSCPPGGTNLQSAKILNGPWTTLNKTNWQGTNVIGNLYFRSMGSKSNATISRRWQ